MNFVPQIENEYGPMEYELGASGRAYTDWAAKMAVGLGTGVPWVMCKQDDAPDPIVSAPRPNVLLIFVYSVDLLFFSCSRDNAGGPHVMFTHPLWGSYQTVCCHLVPS